MLGCLAVGTSVSPCCSEESTVTLVVIVDMDVRVLNCSVALVMSIENLRMVGGLVDYLKFFKRIEFRSKLRQ